MAQGDAGGREALLARIGTSEARLHEVAMRWLDPLPVPAELTLRQVQVLLLVRAKPSLSGQALADHLGVSTPTTSGIVERVVSRGWLEREHDAEDRRRLLLRITPEGEAVLASLEVPVLQAKAHVLDRLRDDELADLARLMERMHEVARELDAERTGPARPTEAGSGGE